MASNGCHFLRLFLDKFSIGSKIKALFYIYKIIINFKLKIMANVGNYDISQAEIVGLEVSKVPLPKSIRMYEDTPLFSYKLFLKYKGRFGRSGKKKTRQLNGRCVLALKTLIKNDEGLVLVQGAIKFKSYCSALEKKINFVPKTKIQCTELFRYIEAYIAKEGQLGEDFFEPNIFGSITNSLFTCKLEPVPMVCGYNKDGTLDKVSVDMSLFKHT